MKKFILVGIIAIASTALADTGEVLCATSDMNGGLESAQKKLNTSMKNIVLKSVSAPVVISDTYFTTVCVSILK